MKTFYKIATDGTLQIGSGVVIPQGFTEYAIGSEPQELLDAQFTSSKKQTKIQDIKQAMNTANSLPVVVNVTDITTSTTADYNFIGGYESAQMLDGKRNLVKESFALRLVADDNVDFRTADDKKVLLSMADATKVVLTVANAYETNFQKYKDLKAQVNIATTQSELDAIVW